MSPLSVEQLPAASLPLTQTTALNGRTDVAMSRLLELVRLRGAQVLGCAEVIEAHARKLLHLGESMGRIGHVYW